MLPDNNTVNDDGFAEVVSSETAVNLWQVAMRLIELVAAVACLALLAPMLLVVAVAIKLDSRGPILVRERRFGYKNRMIKVRKFRSTVVSSGGRKQTPRLTLVGQLLRRTGIEDLPMFINVIRGELSIIGPAPSPYPTACLNDRKPGVTRCAEIFSS